MLCQTPEHGCRSTWCRPEALSRRGPGRAGGDAGNLLRFGTGGREIYARYADALHETFLPRYGGEVLYAGDGSTALVAETGQDWDAVLLVRYPTRRAFSEMVADPEYQRVTAWRTDALQEAVLQATVPWPVQS